MNLKVAKCIYHRNGISGIGFYALEFSYVEEGRARIGIATVDADDVEIIKKNEPFANPGTRVIMLNKANEPIIEETMRGDYFHAALVDWIMKEFKHG